MFTFVVCCCKSCNQSKGHEHWKLWYVQQNFYCEDKFNLIEEWMKPPKPANLYSYRPRKPQHPGAPSMKPLDNPIKPEYTK